MMESAIICDRAYVTGKIDTRIYGSFLEHMGRVIYTGIYEPEHPCADQNGFRRDVLDTVHKMGASIIRYPGGNFVSGYCWEDGVGPQKERPRRLDLAWCAIETNSFGTDEFVRWTKEAGVSPIITVNLGTRGMEDALNYLEYCNFPGGTKFSDLRRSHGAENPYNMKLWCLGNEMDGVWQTGHKNAGEYGRLAAETGRAMKRLDPEIELIACGSSLSTMDTCPSWDMEVLEQTYDVIDYFALHQYYGGQEKGTGFFLAQTLDMEEYIQTIRSAIQVVKKKKRTAKNIYISVDEWGIWASIGNAVDRQVEKNPWQIAPRISEQIYTLEDALLFAGMMMVILRNSDIIKIACQSLLTNVSACIMTEPGGELWLQTIYYPFYCFANYGKGVVLNSRTRSMTYDAAPFSDVPYLDDVVVWNSEANEMVAFLINKNEKEAMCVNLDLREFRLKRVIEFVAMTAEHKKMTNEKNHNAVVLRERNSAEIGSDWCKIWIDRMSFNMIRLEIE